MANVTNRILEAIEQGFLSKDSVIQACLEYMGEDDVKGMAESNNFFEDDDDKDDKANDEDD